jgi:electron-transferring-flavoprotein dehydrogenase
MYTDLPEGVTREQMDVDVLIVGGGAAGLSCALHLSQELEKSAPTVFQEQFLKRMH